MVNGTLSSDIPENLTIRVRLNKKGNKYGPIEGNFKFCDPLEEVMQEGGPLCPPKKGVVEITANYLVYFVSDGDIIETTIEALTPSNKTITCLYGELGVVR